MVSVTGGNIEEICIYLTGVYLSGMVTQESSQMEGTESDKTTNATLKTRDGSSTEGVCVCVCVRERRKRSSAKYLQKAP